MINGIPVTSDALVESVYQFNRLGGKTPPGHFNPERVGFYIGMQLEELAEQVMAVAAGALTHDRRSSLLALATVLDNAGELFKQDHYHGEVLRADRKELLDGGVDSVFVGLGCLIYQTPMFTQAIEEVLLANARKGDGGWQRDENGKVLKPEGWKKPDLSACVDTFGTDL